MARLSAPVKERIVRDFGPGADAVISLLTRYPAGLPLDRAEDAERVQAAAVLLAAGDLDALRRALELGAADWRALIAAAGLDGPDWRTTLDSLSG